MSEIALSFLAYATEHFVLSTIVALSAFALFRINTVAPETRAGALLLALMFSVVAPLLPTPAIDPGNSVAAASVESRPDIAPVAASQAGDNSKPQIQNHLHGERIEITASMAVWLVAVWLLGIAWNGARLASGIVRTRRIIAASARSRPLESDYRDVLPKGTQIRVSAGHGPAVVGVLRPRILIPRELVAALPEASLRAVVLHEASHVERRDPLAYACQTIAETMLWWNPVFGWMARMLDSARETACDLRASRSSESNVDYADALLVAIERMVLTERKRTVAALGMTSAMHSLDRRIEDIIDERKPMGAAGRIALVTLGLAATGVWLAADAALPELDIQAIDIATPTSTSQTTPRATTGVDATDRRDAPLATAAADDDAQQLELRDEEALAIAENKALLALHAEYETRFWQINEDHMSAIAIIDADFRSARAQTDAIPTSDEYERRLKAVEQDHTDAMNIADDRLTRALTRADTTLESSTRALEADYARRRANQRITAKNAR